MRSVEPLSRNRLQQFEGFIVRVMEPLADEELVDTQYNALVRRSRHRAWTEAARTTEYHQALLDMATASESSVKAIPKLALAIPPRDQCLRWYRQALVEQLLTPAEQKSNVEWKKRQLADCPHLPVAQKDVEAAILADEKFLASHPVKRTGRSVQC